MMKFLQTYQKGFPFGLCKKYENFQDQTSSGSIAEGQIGSLDDTKK